MSIPQSTPSNCIKIACGFDAAAASGDTNTPIGLFPLAPGQSIASWIVREKRHPTNPIPLTGPVNVKAGTNYPDCDNIIQGVSNSVGQQLYREGPGRYANDGDLPHDPPQTVYAYIDSQSIEGTIFIEFMVHLLPA